MPTTQAPLSGSESDTGGHAQDSCAVCPHPMNAHDRIGVRYCSATASGGLNRECVCSGVVSQRNYKRS